MEKDKMQKLIDLCPYLDKSVNLLEAVERMEKAYEMNGGILTDDHIQNAINYLLDLDNENSIILF